MQLGTHTLRASITDVLGTGTGISLSHPFLITLHWNILTFGPIDLIIHGFLLNVQVQVLNAKRCW